MLYSSLDLNVIYIRLDNKAVGTECVYYCIVSRGVKFSGSFGAVQKRCRFNGLKFLNGIYKIRVENFTKLSDN